MIKDNIFSLYLAKTDKQSKLWIGGYDTEYVKSALRSKFSESELEAMTTAEI